MSSLTDLLQLWTFTATTASTVNVTETATDVTTVTNASESTSEAPTNVTDRHHRTGITFFVLRRFLEAKIETT